MKHLSTALILALGLLVAGSALVWGPGVTASAPAQQPAPTAAPVNVTPSSVAATPYPQLLARVSITRAGDLMDFARDAEGGRLFVSSSRQTFVVDESSLQVTDQVPFGGELLVDAANRRLYVYPGVYSDLWIGDDGEASSIHVIDLDTLAVIGELPNATHVAVDAAQQRLFTGAPWRPSAAGEGQAPVRIYDGNSLEVTGELTVTGIPVYNPVRGDLVVLHEGATVFDLATGDVIAELLPQLVGQQLPFCNGCEYAEDGAVFVDENLLVIELGRIATGAGPGFNPPPRFYDAETLASLEPGDVPYLFQATCSSTPRLQAPIEGKFYRNLVYRRYVAVENFIVEDLARKQVALRDGLYAVFVNPTTRQAIVDQGYVLGLATLAPIGRFPTFCWYAYDAQSGRFYGRDGGDLLIMQEEGGTASISSEPVLPEAVANVVLTQPVASIVPSPDFAHDQTVFAFVEGQGIVRSTDGGDSWVRLQGGLPQGDGLVLDLAISPDFAQDQTLFAGGSTRIYQGEGVLRSQDGGETWQPMWQGMDYLRVREVMVAPDYATSGSVAALTEYNRLEPWDSGMAIFTSTNRGLDWTLVMTGASSLSLPTLAEVVGTPDTDLPVRLAHFGDGISVTVDGGVTWQLAELGRAGNDFFKQIVVAPDYPDDPAIYVMSRFGLWRTLDGGASWARWTDARLEGRDYNNELTAVALARGADAASHWLFVGTAAGEIWVMQAESGGSRQAAPAPGFVVPTEGVTPTAVVPTATMTAVTAAVTATALPTTTPMLTPTLVPTATVEPLQGEPPEGLYRPGGTLANRWESDPALQQAIGWALQPVADPVQMARQTFTGGLMLWRGDTRQIYVIYNDNRWAVYDDTFVEGEAEFDPAITPPTGYRQPIRGFGKVWREHADVRQEIGWATDKEQGFGGFVHPFERGILITGGDRTLSLIERDSTRTWR